MVTKMGIAGDQQSDPVNHGGVDKAILCYAREHYTLWSHELGTKAPALGALGENFEIGEAVEEEVCIGDIVQVGEVILPISPPLAP